MMKLKNILLKSIFFLAVVKFVIDWLWMILVIIKRPNNIKTLGKRNIKKAGSSPIFFIICCIFSLPDVSNNPIIISPKKESKGRK